MIPEIEHEKDWDANVYQEFETDYLHPLWIDPLKEFGFEFIGLKSLRDNETNMGCHILFFQHALDRTELFSKKDYDQIVKICTQDDDGQPHATYRLYMGDLYVMIPFYI